MIIWRIISKRSQEGKELLKFIHIELLKLRRRKCLILTLAASPIMPFLSMLYFKYIGKPNVEPVLFYKWSVFGFTCWMILPFILGILSSLLFYTESSNHINTYFWIIPVCKLKYFFGKFFILFIYSFIFILLTFIWTVLFADLSGCVAQEISSIFYLSRKCIEISILLPLVMLPLLAAAMLINGYVLPVCLTLVYIFSGFMLAPQSPCLHPLSAFSVLLNRDGEIPGVPMSPPSLLVSACYCILLWDFFSVLIAGISLKKKS